MLIKPQPKYNPTEKSGKKEIKPIEVLHSKLKDFITAKMPTINKWTLNELYVEGLDKDSFDWQFGVYYINTLSEQINKETGEKIILPRATTKAGEFGRYRYNMKGIPSIFNNYIDDITAREQVAEIKSMRFGELDKALVSRIVNQGMINDVDWETEINPKIIHDVLCKGDGFGMVSTYNQVREVHKWKKLDKDGRIVYDTETEEISDKRGCYIEYLPSEFVFPEPNTENPKEFFVAKPYTYSQFVQEFPDLEDKVIKNGNEKGQLNNGTYSDKNIHTTNPFPYRTADKLIDTYRNFDKKEKPESYYQASSIPSLAGKIANNEAWFNGVFNDKYTASIHSNLFGKDDKIWVWTYYNISYDPHTNKVGDTCVMFVNNYQLYSGAIPHADKEAPFIKFSFKPNKGTYWSNSMVDQLRPLQDEINEIENIRKNNLAHLMTTNLIANTKLLKGSISLQRREINVIDVESENDTNFAQTPLNVNQVVQPLQLGNNNGLQAADLDIAELLSQMESLYPKPISQMQLQPEQNIKDNNFSPVLRVNTIIKRINTFLSKLGLKFLKETIHTILYFNKLDKKEIYLDIQNLPIKVVATEEERIISLAKDVTVKYNAQLQQQVSEAQQQGMQVDINNIPTIDINQIKTINNAYFALSSIGNSGFPINTETLYFVYDNLIQFGESGLDLQVRINKSRRELINENKEFLAEIAALGGVYLDPSKIANKLAILYNQDLDMLLSNPPDALAQAIIRQTRVMFQDNLAEETTNKILTRLLGEDFTNIAYNPNGLKISDFFTKQTINGNISVAIEEEKQKFAVQGKAMLNSLDKLTNRDVTDAPVLPNAPSEPTNPTDVNPATELPNNENIGNSNSGVQRPSAGMSM